MRQREETSQGGSTQMHRIGWVLGVIAPVLMMVGFFAVAEGGTELSGSTSDIVSHLSDLRPRIVIGSVIGILGAFALIGFAASLRIWMSGTDGRGEWLGTVAFGSGLIMATGAIVLGSFQMSVAAIVGSGGPPDEMFPLWELDSVIAILAWGAVGLVATMCLAAFTINLLPKLLAAIGAVLVAGTVALSPTDHGGVSLSLLLWLMAASIVLLARKEGPISR